MMAWKDILGLVRLYAVMTQMLDLLKSYNKESHCRTLNIVEESLEPGWIDRWLVGDR